MKSASSRSVLVYLAAVFVVGLAIGVMTGYTVARRSPTRLPTAQKFEDEWLAKYRAELDLTDEQVAAIRPVVHEHVNNLGGIWYRAIMTMGAVQESVDRKIEPLLNDQQRKSLVAWIRKSREKRLEIARERFGGQTGKLDSIHYASAVGDWEAIQRHLQAGVDINKRDLAFSMTPLAVAAIHGQVGAVERLLLEGADIEARSPDGNTALHGAAFFGRAKVVERLLASGADPEARNEEGKTPLEGMQADWETIQFIAAILLVELDPEDVRTGREAVSGLLRAAEQEMRGTASPTDVPAVGTGQLPRMHFADTVSGKPFSKDPAVVRFAGAYWLYYSIPPYEGKANRGWTIGVATSDNLVDWTKAGELTATGPAEAKGFTAPGAIVLGGQVHLFYQTYGNGKDDAICHAWSTDGLHFERNPTNPVFRPTGDWNCGRAIDADVIVFGGRLLLYWATRDPAMKIQMQGVSAAALDSDYSRGEWTQLNPDSSILAPQVPSELDDPELDLAWERQCIEAAAMAVHGGRLYMFYAGGYNNEPQQIGVAVSDDGIRFRRLSDQPLVPSGPPGSWNHSESGHPFLFQDEDGRDYLFYQGNNTMGQDWFLSVVPIDWRDGRPVLAPEKLPPR